MRAGKLVVLGRGEAGKSTLIRSLCRRPLNLQVNGRTVAMDHGTMALGERVLQVVGVPGQERFAPVREVLVTGAIGAVWVHPAGEAPDPVTGALLAREAAGLPYVVYVNHRDGVLDCGFSRPPELPVPRAVIRGNLVRPGATLLALEEEIWKLLSHSTVPEN